MDRIPRKGIVLITGATGFVGRSLCARLLAQGLSVRGTMLNSEDSASLVDGVEPVVIEPIGSNTLWSRALSGVDTIIHLAARVHVMNNTSEDPLAAYRHVNVSGTENLAYQAAAFGVKRLVFISTVKVHGEETDVPYTEDDPLVPEDPYGVSKREAEDALRRVAADTGLEVVIIRAPLVYGPGVKANFRKLLSIVQQGLPLPFAGINNRRSLIYLGNLIDVIIACAVHPSAAGQTFLVSDGEDVSTPELIRRTAYALGIPARLFPVPLSLLRLAGKLTGRSAAVNRLTGSLTVDSSKIRRELGWRPPFTMEEGLRETADWFKNSSS